MPLDAVEQLMSQGVEKYTEHTTVSFARMKDELARVKATGYAVNDEELLPGYLVLAAPVLDSSRRTVGAVSVTLPVDREHSERKSLYAVLLCEAARTTSIQLGYIPHFGIEQSKPA